MERFAPDQLQKRAVSSYFATRVEQRGNAQRQRFKCAKAAARA
jgi:hypothetical protein